MNRSDGGRLSLITRGSSAASGMITAPPPLTVWSTPWSKNCPKSVNQELYGAESPASGVTFGMPPAGSPPRAAATAAGLLVLWSAIRLLISRGSASVAFRSAYPGRVCAGTSRGNAWSAAPKPAWPAPRWLHEPSVYKRQGGVRDVRLSDLDLPEDVGEVGRGHGEPLADRGGLRGRRGDDRGGQHGSYRYGGTKLRQRDALPARFARICRTCWEGPLWSGSSGT